MNKRWLFFLIFMLLFAALTSRVAAPLLAETKVGAIKSETALEKRVRVVASKLRCPVCQGESVYDSHADVAVEMKKLITERLTKGESEADILGYFQARYGNFILMEPPAQGVHWVIWVFPAFLGLVGFLFVYQFITQTRGQSKIAQQSIDGETIDESGDESDPNAAPDVRELSL